MFFGAEVFVGLALHKCEARREVVEDPQFSNCLFCLSCRPILQKTSIERHLIPLDRRLMNKPYKGSFDKRIFFNDNNKLALCSATILSPIRDTISECWIKFTKQI